MANMEGRPLFSKEELEMAEPLVCSAALMAARNAIQKELDSEEAAGKFYRDMAYKFIKMDEPEKAVILRFIANQEEFHRTVLQEIIAAIDKKCGG